MIADCLISDLRFTPEELHKRFPSRSLPDGAMVTRLGPSPTGYFHIGGVYAALISERLAHQSNGIFFLRIEDTDRKREVEGASRLIIQSIQEYGLRIDEGETVSGSEIGDYGPYRQSHRADIYRVFIHQLLVENKAYACFATTEDLEEIRERQERLKVRPGYYGKWAVWRDRTEQEVIRALKDGKPFVIRLKSHGDIDRKVIVHDLIRGSLELPENDQDIVILKSDGLPTYHLAHVVDDRLMGTTHVIRGDEWVSSIPLHLQLFQSFGWLPPRYGHIAPIQKMDGNSRRKLSKRKDPEASIIYYNHQGYPPESVIEYLLNLADSKFEDWRRSNPLLSSDHFNLDISNFSKSGALFDVIKLNSISKDIISSFSAKEIYERGLKWTSVYNLILAENMKRDALYTQQSLNIERQGNQVRKDIAKWSDLEFEIGYFFDDIFNEHVKDFLSRLSDININHVRPAIKEFVVNYQESDSKDEWFLKLRTIATSHGYAESTKIYKKDPSEYKGHVGDVAKVIRVLLTGRNQSPDLWEIMKVMGKERVYQRLSKIDLPA